MCVCVSICLFASSREAHHGLRVVIVTVALCVFPSAPFHLDREDRKKDGGTLHGRRNGTTLENRRCKVPPRSLPICPSTHPLIHSSTHSRIPSHPIHSKSCVQYMYMRCTWSQLRRMGSPRAVCDTGHGHSKAGCRTANFIMGVFTSSPAMIPVTYVVHSTRRVTESLYRNLTMCVPCS